MKYVGNNSLVLKCEECGSYSCGSGRLKCYTLVEQMNRSDRRKLSKMSPIQLLKSGHFTPEIIEWIKERQREGVPPEKLKNFVWHISQKVVRAK